MGAPSSLALAAPKGRSAASGGRAPLRRMRLGVTGRSRTGTGGVTSRSSAIELRPHPSARDELSKGDGTRLGPPFEDVALVCVRKPVGKPAHLDRPALFVDFDRQQPVDAILRPPT
jgi:hypothetical protein